ncbi:RHS repeat protein [Pseudomonas moraviensis subsp. stanleyae]|uniref:RHS repeat domain-containing protein n=1 Tax=Pseudomonas moraviensis TaxID=321662 RepID=UPI002E334B9D|nr:RHS repeat-associated core domain-containing protein [Pseudomonas moraviensis]MED7667732.1 RHS repeat protein [Pseudomonas moraviensis subsp. stanleyae]
MTHAHTPAIQAFDPRGLVLRGINYHRRESQSTPENFITRQTYDAAGRPSSSHDPRMFQADQPANQSNVFSLSTALLLDENADAGWRLSMNAEDGIPLEHWDQQRNHSRISYDALRRPSTRYEQAVDEPERCTERFTYLPGTLEDAANRCGRLIRHDDTAGSQFFSDFTLNSQAMQVQRTFCADPRWPVDWPQIEADRDTLLEERPATTRYDYNAVEELIAQTDALGNRQIQLQDVAGQLQHIGLTMATSNASQTVISDIRYNAFGTLEHQRAGNGVFSNATFALEDGRLQHLDSRTAAGVLQDLTFVYDAVGNIICLTDDAMTVAHHRNQRTEASCHYRYDSLSRLVEASGRQICNAPAGPLLPVFVCPADPGQLENYARIYTYDRGANLLVMEHRAASGSRTERTAVASGSNRSLPQKTTGQLPDEQEIAAAYDANGNRLFLQNGQALQWSRRNALQQVDHVVRENGTNDSEYYVYDGGGQRLRKIRQTSTGSVQRLVESRYLPGLEVRSSPDQRVNVITIKAGRATVQVLHFETDPPDGIPQDQYRYSFSDHLNSTTLELDAQAQIISRESYYPFGATCWWAGRSLVEANCKTLRYSGKERDATGLYYYGLRYYAPWLQRWLNADPLGSRDGLNLFAMVHGNPVGHVDFQGLVTVKEGISAALATFARDGLSALAGGAVRYFAAEGMQQWASDGPDSPPDPGVNLGVTVAGAFVGAMAGGAMGIGAGSRIASSRNYDRSVQTLMAGIFGLAGAAAGAAAPLYAYLADRQALNLTAIGILASVQGNMTREAGQRTLANVGPNVTLAPSGANAVMRAAPYAALLFAGGVGRSEIAAGAGVAVSAVVEGLDGMSITAIHSMRGGEFRRPEEHGLSLPNAGEWLYGVTTRTAGGLLTSSLTALASPLTNAIDEPLRSGVVASLGAHAETRTYLGQHVQLGAFELYRSDDADFTLDQFTAANGVWRSSTPESYHPELRSEIDLPMSVLGRRNSA